MFDHLDDPTPFHADERFRTRVRARSQRLRRRRRLAQTGVGSVTAVLLAGVGVVAWDANRLDHVRKVEVGAVLDPVPGGGPVTILVVGTDAPVPGSPRPVRADQIALVRLAPDGKASVMQLPRDLAFPDEGAGVPARLSHEFQVGGAQRLIAVVEQRLGVPIQHYVQLDFTGFAALVDAVGGLSVRVQPALRDESTGLALDAGACVRLDGSQALALSRSRHVERYVGGRWQWDPSSDIGRMARQAVLGREVLQALHSAAGDPVALQRLVDAFVTHATVDSGLHLGSLLDLARRTGGLAPDSVREAWLPLEMRTGPIAGGEPAEQAAYLVPGPEAAAAVAAFGQGRNWGQPGVLAPKTPGAPATSSLPGAPVGPMLGLAPC